MNVIKIAICDDEEKAVALHERIVKACLQSQGIGYEITTYTQSRNLLYDITDDGFFYDLILLDIEMPGISGMLPTGARLAVAHSLMPWSMATSKAAATRVMSAEIKRSLPLPAAPGGGRVL